MNKKKPTKNNSGDDSILDDSSSVCSEIMIGSSEDELDCSDNESECSYDNNESVVEESESYDEESENCEEESDSYDEESENGSDDDSESCDDESEYYEEESDSCDEKETLNEEEITKDTKLNDKWILWYHHEKNNWKINGYRKIYKIETIKDFWELYNNFDRIGGINNQHFFLMREGIEPIWEDDMNKKGGCWSYKKMENESAELWEDLSVRTVGETLLDDNSDINGLSICLKRQSNSVIKIWNKNSKNNNISLLNKEILSKYGKEILYIAHIPEF